MRPTSILTARWFVEEASQRAHRVPPGMAWVPTRPPGEPGFTHRLRAAWLVFTGGADAVQWESQP